MRRALGARRRDVAAGGANNSLTVSRSGGNLVISDTNTFGDIFVRDQGLGWYSYSISGTVTEVGGTPMSGVVVSSDSGASALTGIDGGYVITDVISGTYTLTPFLDGYLFTPISTTVSVPPDAAGIDFVATKAMLFITLPMVVK